MEGPTVDKELRRRQRNNARLQRQEDDRQLIADGQGPRKAKTTALKNATWYEAEGKKRPRPPSPDDHDQGERERADEDKQPRKRLQKGSGRHGGGESEHGKVSERKETRAKSQKATEAPQSDIHNDVRKGPKPTKSKPTKIQQTNPIEVGDSDESSSLSSLDDDSEGDKDGSDDEDGENDDDYDVAQMSDGEARRMFDDELPQAPNNAASLFENDNDIEIATNKSDRSQRWSSSEASRPPTSESEGMFDDRGDSGEEEVDDDDDLPRHVFVSSRGSNRSKSNQRPRKRDAALNAERPTTQAVRSMVQKSKSKSKLKAGAVAIESDDGDKTVPEDNWPKALRLRTGALTQQTDLIRVVCREAIRIVEKTLVTEHAWPELHKGTLYKRQVLLEAVKLLRAKNTEDDEGEQDAQYKVLNSRLSNDETFVRQIGKWVVDRLSHHRGQLRSAASDQIAIFQLGVGDGCSQRVHALIENDVYVYPGHWAVDKDDKPVWMVKNSLTDIQIYLNPGLVELIKTAFFNGPTGFGYKFKKYYVSSHPDHKAPELTIPIVALGATAFFAALYEWREGKKGKMSADSQKTKAERFEGDNFKKVYDRHVETLTKLKKKANAYHKFMSELYSKVTDGDNATDAGALIKGSALAVLDLDGLD